MTLSKGYRPRLRRRFPDRPDLPAKKDACVRDLAQIVSRAPYARASRVTPGIGSLSILKVGAGRANN